MLCVNKTWSNKTKALWPPLETAVHMSMPGQESSNIKTNLSASHKDLLVIRTNLSQPCVNHCHQLSFTHALHQQISDSHVKAETKSIPLLTYSKGSGLWAHRGTVWHLSDNDDRIIIFARQSPNKADGSTSPYGWSRMGRVGPTMASHVDLQSLPGNTVRHVGYMFKEYRKVIFSQYGGMGLL